MHGTHLIGFPSVHGRSALVFTETFSPEYANEIYLVEFLLPDSRKSVLVGVQIAVRVAVLVRIQIRRDPDLDLDPIFQTRARMHGAFYATEEPLV